MRFPVKVPCDTLFAGLDYSIVGMVALALTIVAVLFAVRATNRRSSRVSVAVALLLLMAMGVGAGIASPNAARAATPACSAPAASVAVTQTSTISGLAPGSPAMPITGMVTNTGISDIAMKEVFVSVSHVAGTPGTEHSCGVSDFVITGARMLVNKTLAPGASTVFSGAVIELANLASNQDSCKGAALQLRYDFSGP